MFSITRKSGTLRDSERPDDLDLKNIFLDVPFGSSVCLIDDIEKLIVTNVAVFNLYDYKIMDFPDSHYV